MRLRTAALIVALALSLLVAPLAAEAQQPAKVARIGFLAPGTGPGRLFDVFRQELRRLGWMEGQNIAIETRWAERPDHLPDLTADLVRLKVDVIVSGTGTPGAVAAKNATKTIPIVMVAVGDAVGSGLVASLARPGGNITGLSILTPELVGKRLEVLKESLSTIGSLALLRNPANPRAAPLLEEVQVAARALGLELHLFDVRGPTELDSTFLAMTKARAGALYVTGDPLFYSQRRAIISLAAKSRLPAMYDERVYPEAGGLISYGASYGDLFRRAATYVDKILKGAKPADLPVEQPTKFELVINMKTAKALGLTIPQSVLFRADHLIK